jgi:hypothetical protein
MLAEHDRGRRDNATWLWSLLVLELWFRDLEQGAGAPSAACGSSSKTLN